MKDPGTTGSKCDEVIDQEFAAATALGVAMASSAFAAEPESCKAVRFADVGWTDIQVTTGATSVVLEALGYQPEVSTLSVPVTYASLKNKDIDVFLGNWMPTMTADIQPYLDDKSVEQIGDQSRGRGLRPRRSAICGGCGRQVAGRSRRQCREVRRQDLWHRGRQ